jgi:hypothetical protein
MFQITNFNDIIPLAVISKDFVINTVVITARVVMLLSYALYLLLNIIFDDLYHIASIAYDYVFGTNHTMALVVFSTVAIITIMAYDKLLTIETNMRLHKSLQKQIYELENQTERLKGQLTGDLQLAYMRLYKDSELNELNRDIKIRTLSNKIQRLEREVKQYI